MPEPAVALLGSIVLEIGTPTAAAGIVAAAGWWCGVAMAH